MVFQRIFGIKREEHSLLELSVVSFVGRTLSIGFIHSTSGPCLREQTTSQVDRLACKKKSARIFSMPLLSLDSRVRIRLRAQSMLAACITLMQSQSTSLQRRRVIQYRTENNSRCVRWAYNMARAPPRRY